jgi:hypothetical protein
MLADVVLRLPNNPKSEEKGEINRTLNPKRMIKNVGGGNCKTASYDSIIHPQASRISAQPHREDTIPLRLLHHKMHLSLTSPFSFNSNDPCSI